MPYPSPLTPELIDKIEGYIRDGSYVETAVVAAGISRKTFYQWLRLGAEDAESGNESIHRVFFERLDRAFAEAEARLLADVSKGSLGWQARAWILERTRHARFGQRQQIEVTQDVTVTQLSLPAPAPDFKAWLAQVVAAERELGRLRPPPELDSIEDAEIVSDSEQLERVTSDETRKEKA